MSEDPYSGVVPEPDDGETAALIADFWAAARPSAGIGRIDVVVGPSVAGTLPPQAWAFGDNPVLADELLAAVLAGRKTGTTSALEEFGDIEPIPEVGDLSILLDGSGRPRALIRTTSVTVLPFGDVDAEFAASEGEDDGSLDAWREGHRAYFSRVLGRDIDDGLTVVCERFELRYPR